MINAITEMLLFVCTTLFGIIGILFFVAIIIWGLRGIFALTKFVIDENKLEKENKLGYRRGYDEGYSVAFDLIDDWSKAKKSYRPWK